MPSLRLSSIVFERGGPRSREIRVLSYVDGSVVEAREMLNVALAYVNLPENERDGFSIPWMPETLMYTGNVKGVYCAKGIYFQEFRERGMPLEIECSTGVNGGTSDSIQQN